MFYVGRMLDKKLNSIIIAKTDLDPTMLDQDVCCIAQHGYFAETQCDYCCSFYEDRFYRQFSEFDSKYCECPGTGQKVLVEVSVVCNCQTVPDNTSYIITIYDDKDVTEDQECVPKYQFTVLYTMDSQSEFKKILNKYLSCFDYLTEYHNTSYRLRSTKASVESYIKCVKVLIHKIVDAPDTSGNAVDVICEHVGRVKNTKSREKKDVRVPQKAKKQ